MEFRLNEEQVAKLNEWASEQDKIVLERQRVKIEKDGGDAFQVAMAEEGIAYYGCCGGELTFIFVPTSIGTFISVKHGVTGAELDLENGDSF